MKDIGWVGRDSQGEHPLTWTEVLSYSQATESVSEPWELRLMVRMSDAYLSGRVQGENPFSMHPSEIEEF